MDIIRISKLHETTFLPTRKHETDAGMDLYSDADYIIEAHKAKVISTGVLIDIPTGVVGLIWPKSRSNYLIGGGVIDAGYQGEILVKIINPLERAIVVAKGQAIAQILFQEILIPKSIVIVDKDNLFEEKSVRGATGGIIDTTKLPTFINEQTEAKFYKWWD